MTYEIIIPTLGKSFLISCMDAIQKYTTQDVTTHIIRKGSTWAEAVNIGINKYPKADIILMDDDITVKKEWLDNIEEYKKDADIISWTLIRTNGEIQFSGCYLYKSDERYFMGNYNDILKKPRNTPNASTSCIYIKRKVFDKIGVLDNETYKKGYHYEDSDFCMRAKKAGFKIIVIPELVQHLETATKKHIKGFYTGVVHNGKIFYDKVNNDKEYLKQMENEGFIKDKNGC